MANKLNLVFELTQECNLDCIYCYNIWKSNIDHSREFSYTQAIKTLNNLLKTADIQSVTLTGGEPFTCDRLEEIALHLRLKNVEVSIISNGSFPDKKRYEYLINIGSHVFEFPLLSHIPSIHDYLTKKPNSWSDSVKSIELVEELGGYVVGVIVLTNKNISNVEETIRLLESLNADHIMINRYNVSGNYYQHKEDLIPTKKDLNQAYQIINKIAENSEISISSNVCTPYCILNPKDFPAITYSSCNRDIYDLPITLEINGNIRRCNHSPVVLGNIFKENIYTILERFNMNSTYKSKPHICSACSEYDFCLGGCVGAAEQLNKELMVDPIIEMIK